MSGDGAAGQKYYRDGHIREIAEYCESDVLNTYRVWLRHELFRGRLSDAEFWASETNLAEFVKARGQHEAASRLPDVSSASGSATVSASAAPYGPMSASTSSGHNAANAYRRFVP
jgi:hypothetical protein